MEGQWERLRRRPQEVADAEFTSEINRLKLKRNTLGALVPAEKVEPITTHLTLWRLSILARDTLEIRGQWFSRQRGNIPFHLFHAPQFKSPNS